MNGAKKPGHWVEQAISVARYFSEPLASEHERQEALIQLDAMIHALQDLREHLRAVPSPEERRQIAEAADTIEQFLVSMKARPEVAASFRMATAPKSSTVARKRENIGSLVEHLESKTTDDIQRALLNEREYSLPVLQAIARHIGLTIDRSSDRSVLVDRIVKLGFANKRGYELLGAKRQSR